MNCDHIRKLLLRLFDYLILPILILIFLFEPNYLHGYIFSFDEGQHLAWISGILKGKIPYRDLYMVYGPLLEYIPALLMKLFGYSLQVLRSFYHFGTIISLVIGYFLSRTIIKSRLFVFFATWLMINLSVITMWSSKWGGIRLGSGLLALLLLVYYFKSKNKRILYACGLATGLSFLISQEIGICAIVSGLLSVSYFNFYCKDNFPKLIQKVSIYSLGIITAVLPFFVYFIFKNAFLEYLRIMFFEVPFKFPLIYKDVYPFLSLPSKLSLNIWINYLTSTTFYFYSIALLYSLSIIYLIKCAIQRKLTEKGLYLLILVGFGLPLFRAATRMLGGPQFNISLPPVLIILCLLLESIYSKAKTYFKNVLKLFRTDRSTMQRNELCFCGSGKKYKNCCLGKNSLFYNLAMFSLSSLIVVFYLINVFVSTRPEIRIHRMFNKFMTYKQERHSLEPLELKYAGGVYVPFEQADTITSVVNYIEANVALDERIFVLPHEGHYYFLLNRPTATRFDSALFAEVDPKYQKEVINNLERQKVRYVIYDRSSYLVTDHNPVANEKRIPVIVDYILNNYSVEKEIKGTLILKRKSAT
jgi:hypothetical protein